MKHIPLRTCVVCRAQREKEDLLRVVKAKDGSVAVDKSGKADGRGAYICKDGECLTVAVKKKLLNKAFKTQLPQEAYDEIVRAANDER